MLVREGFFPTENTTSCGRLSVLKKKEDLFEAGEV
jgi:hypothetical protein